MDKLIEDLKDPSWWFTVVIIGIIASCIGSFFHSAISNLVAKASKTYAARRKIVRQKKEEEICLIASSETLLIAELVRAGFAMVFTLIIFVVFIGSYAVYRSSLFTDSSERYVYLITSWASGLGTIPMMSMSGRLIDEAVEALLRYRKFVRKKLNEKSIAGPPSSVT